MFMSPSAKQAGGEVRSFPDFFHHILPVPLSQTHTSVDDKVPGTVHRRKRARLQRRSHFPAAIFPELFDNLWAQPPASVRQTVELKAKSNILNTLPLTTLLSIT